MGLMGTVLDAGDKILKHKAQTLSSLKRAKLASVLGAPALRGLPTRLSSSEKEPVLTCEATSSS